MKIFQNEEDLKDLFDFEYVDTDHFNMTTLRDFSFHKEHNLHIQLKKKSITVLGVVIKPI